jgi:hypothetical protein
VPTTWSNRKFDFRRWHERDLPKFLLSGSDQVVSVLTLLLGAFALTPQTASAGTLNPAVALGKVDLSSGVEQVRYYRYYRYRPVHRYRYHRRYRY